MLRTPFAYTISTESARNPCYWHGLSNVRAHKSASAFHARSFRHQRKQGARPLRTTADSKDLLEEPGRVAGYVELFRFAVGCFGIYIATPLLSLVDSAFVGRFAGTSQLAALGPATSLCDSSVYVLSCIGVATTNMYASHRARGRFVAARRVASDALTIGLFCGALLGIVLFTLAEVVLGVWNLERSVCLHAASYIRVRAFGMPLALLGTAAQAACLGEKDSLTPVLVVGISTIANILGDAWLVPLLGTSGAAIATVASQAIGVVYLLGALRRRQLKMSRLWPQPFGSSFQQPGPFLSLPRRRAVRRFLALALPVGAALIGKIVFINGLTVAAAAVGTVALAAHQVAVNQFFLFCKAGDSLGSAAQAYLPAARTGDGARGARNLIVRILKLSAGWGLTNGLLASLLPVVASDFFTVDASVRAGILDVCPLLAAGLVGHCTTLALEGVLLATGRGTWLARIYWLNSIVFVSALLAGTSSSWAHGGLVYVWACLTVFQVARLVQFGRRVWLDNWMS